MTRRYVNIPFKGTAHRWAGVLYAWGVFNGPRIIRSPIKGGSKIEAKPGDIVVYNTGFAPIHEASYAVVEELRELKQLTYDEARHLANERGLLL